MLGRKAVSHSARWPYPVKDRKLHEILRASTVSVQRPFFRNVTPRSPPAATVTSVRHRNDAARRAAASGVAPVAVGANAVAGRLPLRGLCLTQSALIRKIPGLRTAACAARQRCPLTRHGVGIVSQVLARPSEWLELLSAVYSTALFSFCVRSHPAETSRSVVSTGLGAHPGQAMETPAAHRLTVASSVLVALETFENIVGTHEARVRRGHCGQLRARGAAAQ